MYKKKAFIIAFSLNSYFLVCIKILITNFKPRMLFFSILGYFSYFKLNSYSFLLYTLYFEIVTLLLKFLGSQNSETKNM